MRPRVEIEEDSKLWPEDEPKLIDIAVNQRLILEVLLDLRDLSIAARRMNEDLAKRLGLT